MIVTDARVARFAETVLQWLADPAARQQQGQRAREHVVRHFSWEANLDRLQAWLPPTLERA